MTRASRRFENMIAKSAENIRLVKTGKGKSIDPK